MKKRKKNENNWQGVGKELARCRQGVGILKQLARLCQQYAKDEGKANEQRMSSEKKSVVEQVFRIANDDAGR